MSVLPREIDIRTAEVFPMKGPIALAALHLEQVEEREDQGGYSVSEAQVQEELDRIFGPDNARGAEYISQLVLWMRNTEEAAEIQGALAKPHQEEADRHIQRSKALGRRVEWLRGRLAILVAGQGGRFSDGIHKVHTRTHAKAQLLGVCSRHEGEHHEHETCGSTFKPADDLPAAFARLKIEPDRKAITDELLRLEGEGKAMPRWAQLVRKIVAVVR
jgi:hypothetical protein